MARESSTPSGPRNNTSAPSRMPNPEMPMGRTCRTRTAGMNANMAVRPASLMPMAWAAMKAASTRTTW